MKVLDIYSKKDLEVLRVNGKTVKEIMDKLFLRFPDAYRKIYDNNLDGLTLWKVDDTPDNDAGYYLPYSNLLLFSDIGILPHELQHIASYDRQNERLAFVRNYKTPLYEMALVEGMTEYLSALSLEQSVEDYFFECFCVAMLSSIDGIFEPFYLPNHDKFISLFPNKKDIYSLMYSLNFYSDGIDVVDSCSKGDIKRIKQSVDDTIDSLIDIELSFDKSFSERCRYSDKFMDLISVEDVKTTLSVVHPGYRDYAYCQIRKRVLGRNR